MKVLIGLLLGALPALAAQTFVLHGLTNVTLGQAVYGSNVYRSPAFTNLGPDGLDGVSIQLGQADSGVFVYPGVVDDTRPGDFMAGKVYGMVNGESDRLICSMRCHEVEDGHHPVEIDFSPLGPTRFTYQAFHRGALIAEITAQPGNMVAYGNYFSPLVPRVNPFWRTLDGGIGALIEFLDLPDNFGPNVFIPGIGDVQADRLFIRIEDTTNVVDFTSRLDITGGGALEWFSIYDTRLGIFRRAHKALPDTLLEAHGGQLTLRGVETNTSPGVAIEVERAERFDATVTPIAFETNAALLITGIGIGQNGQGDILGSVRIERRGDLIALAQIFDLTASTNVDTVVYHQGAEVGRYAGSSASVPVTARLVACGLQARSPDVPPGISVRLDRAVAVTLGNETSYDGDEIRFVASDSVVFAALETMTLVGPGMGSFTIVAEASQPLTRPHLNIVRASGGVALSWVDPNRIFRLERAYGASGPFYDSGISIEYTGDGASASFDLASSDSGFFRLSTSPRPFPEED